MLDIIISRAVQSLHGDHIYQLMEFFTMLGDVKSICALLFIAILVLWSRKRYKESFLLASAVMSSAIVGTILKIVINRPRPTSDTVIVYAVENSQSFPSNHALVSMVFFGLLALFVNKKTFAFFASVIIFFIGLSRIFLGVHWTSDVLAGYLIGLIIIMLVKKYLNHARR